MQVPRSSFFPTPCALRSQVVSADGSNVHALVHRSIVYNKLGRFEGARKSAPASPTLLLVPRPQL
eukprot:COSAG06_NODE_6397_length_2948_cov_3.873289_5_plen_65_part_00